MTEHTILELYGPRQTDGEIGIEIEMEGKRLVCHADGWRLAHDGSLRGQESMEYVLHRPCKEKDVAAKLEALQNALKAGGATLDPSVRCGTHVHVNCQTFTVKEVINFALMYYLFEDLLLEYSGPHRVGNLFCLSAVDAGLVLDQLAQCKQANYLNFLMDNNFRYAGLNYSSLGKYGSLEFRSMRSTDKFQEIAEWVRLLLHVRDASKEIKESRAIVEQVSAQGAWPVFNMVFKDDADKLTFGRSPNEIDAIIMNAAQRIQHVCYTEVQENAQAKADIDMIINGRGQGFNAPMPDIEWRRMAQPRQAPPPAVKPLLERMTPDAFQDYLNYVLIMRRQGDSWDNIRLDLERRNQHPKDIAALVSQADTILLRDKMRKRNKVRRAVED